MSNHPQRGRKVAPGKAKTTKVFTWIIGILAIVGTLTVVMVTMRGKPTDSDSVSSVVPSILPITITPDIASVDPGKPLPSGKTTEGFYYKGNPDAPVTVIEYSDFQCPACAYHNQTLVKQLTTEYINTGKVRLVFHDFPLRMHANAPKAAEAAYCAGDQQKYWEMHDKLFDQQETWAASMNPSLSHFPDYAAEIGVNREEFVACLTNGTHTQQVTDAYMSSMKAGINQTPTFFVNGQQVEISDVFARIDSALSVQKP
jgi:protein-disulfide isomerase